MLYSYEVQNILRRNSVVGIIAFYSYSYPSVLKYVKRLVPKNYERFKRYLVSGDKIFVSTDSSLLIYGLDGKLLKEAGHEGQGPGDFQYISDFIITDTEIIISDYYRKVAFFDLNGHLKKETWAKNNIHALMLINDHLLYMGSRQTVDKGTVRRFFTIVELEDERELMSFADNTMTYALHPSGKKPAFPWFPAPYPDRLILLKEGTNGLSVFMTRSDHFWSYRNGQFIKKRISYDFNSASLTNEDRIAFFDYIEGVNQVEYPTATKRSIVFPQKNELFFGAIPWDKAYALILIDHLIVISEEGAFSERIDFPEELNFSNIFEFFPAEVRLQREGNEVYYYDENEGCLRIFCILPDLPLRRGPRP